MNRNQPPEEAKLERELRKAEERKDLEHVLSTPQGRRLLWRYIAAGRPFSVDAPGDLAHVNYRNGERAASSRIMLEIMGVSVDLFVQMMRENNDG
jgi:hypothetical protein